MRRPILLIFLMFLTGLNPLAAKAAEPEAPFLAIMAAYNAETEVLMDVFGIDPATADQRSVKGITFYEIEVHGLPAVVFQTNMSPTNAAMSTQIALYEYPQITHVLFAGVAGAVDPQWQLGDVVIAEKWAFHAEGAYFNPTPWGDGHIIAEYFEPKFPNFGMFYPDATLVSREGIDGVVAKPFFAINPKLLELSRQAIADIGPLMVGEREAQLHVGGVGVTGPVFMDNAAYREYLHATWDAEIVEMETAAYALVCWVNEVPFLAVRGISDLAGGQQGKNHEREYAPLAARHAAVVLKALIAEMAEES
ncbi:MAG: 5'-methylthioadenosine/S-adenosylhomocysteine nucleosidase [Opitutales bacterium]